eukprot:5579368-Lingulodinium_polyedra.AAC.1
MTSIRLETLRAQVHEVLFGVYRGRAGFLRATLWPIGVCSRGRDSTEEPDGVFPIPGEHLSNA